jgi:hypothetical protein
MLLKRTENHERTLNDESLPPEGYKSKHVQMFQQCLNIWGIEESHFCLGDRDYHMLASNCEAFLL